MTLRQLAPKWPVCALALLAAALQFSLAPPAQAQAGDEQEEAAEGFGASDFESAGVESESEQRVDLGASGGTVITPTQAAEAASRAAAEAAAAEGGDGDSEEGDDGDGLFVPTEEIRVETAIAFPVDI